MKKNEQNYKAEPVGTDSNEKKTKNGHKRLMGIIAAVVLCAAAAVGVIFLVKSLTGAEPAGQISDAPHSYDDSGAFTEPTSEDTEDTVTYSGEAAATRDSGAITDSGAGTEPEAAVSDSEPETEGAAVGGSLPDVTDESSEEVIGISGEVSDETDKTFDSGNGGGYDAIGGSSEPAVTTDTTADTSQTAPQTTTQTAAAASEAATPATQATTASSADTTSYDFFTDVSEIEYDPETFEGVIGDFFN